MILYIFYNADILGIPNITTNEDAMGYVDDINFIVIAKNFQETTKIIRDMMTRQDGGHQWSITHNSLFGVPKSAITHYSRRTIKDPNSDNQLIPLPRPALILDSQTVQETNQFKYLGIIIDAQLRWKEQVQQATANATKWILQF